MCTYTHSHVVASLQKHLYIEMLLHMQLLIPTNAEAEELVQIHDSDYIAFLRTVTPDNQVCSSMITLACCLTSVPS